MKKTTLALAALIALSSGAAMAKVEKKDYQLNFFANIDSGFAFERLDGKSWSEAIDLSYSNLRKEFDSASVHTRVTLATAGGDLKAQLKEANPKLVNKKNLTQEVSISVGLGEAKKLTDSMTDVLPSGAKAGKENDMLLTISSDNKNVNVGDYEGSFAIVFEHGV